MADNDDKYTEGANEQQPSTSQSHSSTFTRTIVRNDECNEASSVEIEIRQKGNRSERIGSNDRSRKVICTPRQFSNGKFDFGDRDEKPKYNITLPPLKEDESKEWSIDELKTLHSCINSYGIDDNCLLHATKNIPNRSMIDIRGKFSEIRELMRVRQEMQVEARKMGWMEQVILPSKTSEIQDWLSAVRAIQNRKRRINDYTDSAMLDYFAHEIKCRPASVDTRKCFRVTDSSTARNASRKQMVDCADYYRFLQTCISGSATLGCKPFDAAIILNILEEIHKEVDDQKYEERRLILAGMFREIQSGDLSSYDFRNTDSDDGTLCVQLNPLGLMREMLELNGEKC